MNPRIITGKYKGQRLEVPNGIRPVTDRVKTAVFSLIDHLLPNADCLDAFAGSGSFGIEALSRGANSVTFVDNNSDSVIVLKRNLDKLKIEENYYFVTKIGFNKFIRSNNRQFDVCFIDPPFDLIENISLSRISSLITSSGIIVLKVPNFFRFRHLVETQGLSVIREKIIGKNQIIILARANE